MTFAILGTFEVNTVTTDIQLANARRADFVPSQPLSLEVGCRATARQTFHSLTSIECHWPPVNASAPSVLALAASLPDVRTPQSATGQVTVSAVPASSLVNWLRVATPHPPTGLDGPGSLSGTVAWGPDPKSSQPTWTGELTFSDGALDLGIADQNPIPLGEVVLHSTPPAPAPPHHRRAAKPADLPADSFDLLPVSLDLGGKTPATLEGHLDATGYTLHLSGSAIPSRLLALGAAVPQLGDGLKDRLERLAIIPSADPSAAAQTTGQASRGGVRGNAILPDTVPTAATPDADQPTHIDLTATRAWGGPQTWSTMAAPATHTRPRR
jgi:AsmA protein